MSKNTIKVFFILGMVFSISLAILYLVLTVIFITKGSGAYRQAFIDEYMINNPGAPINEAIIYASNRENVYMGIGLYILIYHFPQAICSSFLSYSAYQEVEKDSGLIKRESILALVFGIACGSIFSIIGGILGIRYAIDKDYFSDYDEYGDY